MRIKRIAVIGTGFMGNGIIHFFALKGYQVTAVRRRENDDRIFQYLKNELNKNRISHKEYKVILSNTNVIQEIEELTNCDLVIETISEDFESKKRLFSKLDVLCPPHTIFASNTSTISIYKLSKYVNRKEKVVGLHFMSPASVMELVEVIKSHETSEQTVNSVVNLCKETSKTPVLINDSPGFVSSRLVAASINEAAYILMDNVTNERNIDTIARLGTNVPVGPLKLADEIGLDIVLIVLDSLLDNLKNNRYNACPIIRKLVASGYLGKKTGRGFYIYNN